MTEEAKTETTEQTETPVVPSDKGPDLKEENIRDNIEEHNADQDYAPLFESETVTEAQLQGEEVATDEDTASSGPTGDEKPPEEKTEAKETDAEKGAKEKADAEEEAKADDEALKKRAESEGKTVDEIKSEDEAKAEAEEKPDKKDEHISGLNTALTQERKTVKQLKAQIAELEAERDGRKETPEDNTEDPFKDFKVLSDTEYDELLDEDQDAAAKYLYRFQRYQDRQRTIEKDQLAKHKAQSSINELINDGVEALEKVVPGITTGKAAEEVDKLTDFALKSGFDNEVLSAITNPSTRVVTQDGGAFILSGGAAQIVNAIKSAFNASSVNVDQLRSDIRKEVETELRPKIEAEVQKTLIEKLQKDPESGFRSLDMAAGSGLKETQIRTGSISEADYARLSEAEQRALLGG